MRKILTSVLVLVLVAPAIAQVVTDPPKISHAPATSGADATLSQQSPSGNVKDDSISIDYAGGEDDGGGKGGGPPLVGGGPVLVRAHWTAKDHFSTSVTLNRGAASRDMEGCFERSLTSLQANSDNWNYAVPDLDWAAGQDIAHGATCTEAQASSHGDDHYRACRVWRDHQDQNGRGYHYFEYGIYQCTMG